MQRKLVPVQKDKALTTTRASVVKNDKIVPASPKNEKLQPDLDGTLIITAGVHLSRRYYLR